MKPLGGLRFDGAILRVHSNLSNPLLERPYEKIIVDTVKVEIADGPLIFLVPLFLGGSLPPGKQHQLTEQRELRLPQGSTYIVITARVPSDAAASPEELGTDAVDRMLATLSLLYTPALFSQPLFRGFKAKQNELQLAGWLKLTPPFSMDGESATKAVSTVRGNVAADEDRHRRFGLMARFLFKASAYAPSEEKFVLLWTILEIFPMKDTTDIAPISEQLARITGRTANATKEQLGIGRLFGARFDMFTAVLCRFLPRSSVNL